MLNYKNSISSYNKLNNSDLATAVKSRYYQYSPPHLLDPNQKISAKYNTKIHETKNDINTMINEMVNKKTDNQNALQLIKNTNAQAINILNMEKYEQDTTPLKMHQEQYQPQPQYQQQQQFNAPYNPENYGNSYGINQGNNDAQFGGAQQNRNFSPLEQQNLQLRRALNNQVRQNNQLLKRIKFLQLENQDLRNQLKMNQQFSKTLRSTNYNSINPGDMTKSYNRPDHSPLPLSNRNNAPHPPANAYIDPNSLNNYNSRINNPIYNPVRLDQPPLPASNRNYVLPPTNPYFDTNPVNNINSRINVPNNSRQLMSELSQLKQENQSLRQNAIQLLKNNY